MTQNEQAFLTMIAFSEGTVNHPLTVDRGYDVIVTGLDGVYEIFTNYSSHPFENRPGKLINHLGLYSTASGRYQLLKRYFNAYRDSMSLPDFSPQSQDKIALHMICECNATIDIMTGKIISAINKCSSRWASFPGSNYGQPQRKIEQLVQAYVNAGGWTTDLI